jgi:hypothetical protein
MSWITPKEILSSFSQNVSADFQHIQDVTIDTIQDEINLQQDYLISQLNAKTKSYLNEINYELCSAVNISGDLYQISISLAASNILKSFIVRKNALVCSMEEFEECYNCFGFVDDVLYSSEITLTQISPTVYQFNYNNLLSKYYEVAVKYTVDADNVYVPALKTMLRDAVCYNLSSRIDITGEDKLNPLTKYYQSRVEKNEEMLKTFIPNTFSNIRLLFKKSAFTTYRINRS